MSLPPQDRPHRRRNALTGQWVLVSPQRALRPWQGRVERVAEPVLPAHDPHCPLCPGGQRSHGAQNPHYRGPWVFDNDHPALLSPDLITSAEINKGQHDGVHGAPDPVPAGEADPLQAWAPAAGRCRVMVFSPDHARGLPELDTEEIGAVIDTWCDEVQTLGRSHAWVQVFENRGELMGCSQPHPHGQIWATHHLPGEAQAEDRELRAYHARTGRPLLLDLAEREAADGARVVLSSEHWLVVVPWWATWPFETLLLPRAAVARLPELDAARRADLARVLQTLARGLDRLFDCRFPYSMGWHGAPHHWPGEDPAHAAAASAAWTLHAHCLPPLLRSATVRKFMVGYELLAEAQRDLTPEQAAERLRAVMPAL